jgi:hypothetical protein
MIHRRCHQPVRADVLRARHAHRQGQRVALRRQLQVFGPHADLEAAGGLQRRQRLRRQFGLVAAPGHFHGPVTPLARQEIHAGRADEVPHERMRRPLEQRVGRSHLHGLAARHHHHLVGKGQRLGLVVGHVDQRQAEFVVDFLELAPQLPFQVRIDDGQRLVEQDGRHVLAHQPTSQRDLLLGVGGQSAGAAVQRRRQVQHFGYFAHALLDLRGGHAPVAQREGEVLAHRHRVVDHRELEHLGDVPGLRRGVGHVVAVEPDGALRRPQQPRDAVEQRGLAAAGRAQQRIGAAIVEREVQRQQRVVFVLLRMGHIGMGEVEVDARHVRLPTR